MFFEENIVQILGTKWAHKTFCPCMFGRSCLIPNSGYISEAAASIVDRRLGECTYNVDERLGINIVPRTEIISLASPTFHYSIRDRRAAQKNGGQYPPKVGSFQLFMHGYIDASKFLREGPQMLVDGRLPRDPVTGGLSVPLQKQFQESFERLVLLDYIIRNTGVCISILNEC